MANVELFIKIPEIEYQRILNHTEEIMDVTSFIEPKYLYRAILEGTPLPKGHGKLGDLDALRNEVSSWGMNDYEPSDFTAEIDEAPTIIPADGKIIND